MTPQYRRMILEGELTPVSKLSGAFLNPASSEHLQFAYYESSMVVKFLVERGFPVGDKFEKVVSPLALWFGFVELFGEDRDRIKRVIHQFVLTRHNGKITRLLTGKHAEVRSHIDRIVDRILDGEDDQGKEMFALLRQHRTNGKYKQVYRFEPEIMGTEDAPSFSINPNNSIPFYLICGGLREENSDSDWQYEPDHKPLPECVLNQIRDAFKEYKRQLRRNKTTGRYPTLDAITEFFNYLFCHFFRPMPFCFDPLQAMPTDKIIIVPEYPER